MAIEAAIGKLSSEAMGKAVVKSDELAKPAQDSSFKAMMSEMDSGNEFANAIGFGENSMEMDPTYQLQSLSADNLAFTPADGATGISDPAASEKVMDMLGEVNKGHMQMDNLVNHVLYSGKKFSNQELLVIQAHVFHFAQITELTVKLAEQGVNSVKTVLNTQVQ